MAISAFILTLFKRRKGMENGKTENRTIINRADYSPNGRYLVTDGGKNVVVWDVVVGIVSPTIGASAGDDNATRGWCPPP